MCATNSSAAEQESLDIEVLNQLHEDMGEDVDEVVNAFLESIDELLMNLKSRLASENSGSVARWAHSVKSSAASIGMMKLSHIAFTLESAMKNGRNVDLDLLISQIEDEYNHARSLLRSLN